MSATYVGAPNAVGEFILRDVTVVDVADGCRTGGQDIRIADGTKRHAHRRRRHALCVRHLRPGQPTVSALRVRGLALPPGGGSGR
jgi:hypothetical protein